MLNRRALDFLLVNSILKVIYVKNCKVTITPQLRKKIRFYLLSQSEDIMKHFLITLLLCSSALYSMDKTLEKEEKPTPFSKRSLEAAGVPQSSDLNEEKIAAICGLDGELNTMPASSKKNEEHQVDAKIASLLLDQKVSSGKKSRGRFKKKDPIITLSGVETADDEQEELIEEAPRSPRSFGSKNKSPRGIKKSPREKKSPRITLKSRNESKSARGSESEKKEKKRGFLSARKKTKKQEPEERLRYILVFYAKKTLSKFEETQKKEFELYLREQKLEHIERHGKATPMEQEQFVQIIKETYVKHKSTKEKLMRYLIYIQEWATLDDNEALFSEELIDLLNDTITEVHTKSEEFLKNRTPKQIVESFLTNRLKKKEKQIQNRTKPTQANMEFFGTFGYNPYVRDEGELKKSPRQRSSAQDVQKEPAHMTQSLSAVKTIAKKSGTGSLPSSPHVGWQRAKKRTATTTQPPEEPLPPLALERIPDYRSDSDSAYDDDENDSLSSIDGSLFYCQGCEQEMTQAAIYCTSCEYQRKQDLVDQEDSESELPPLPPPRRGHGNTDDLVRPTHPLPEFPPKKPLPPTPGRE